MPKKGLSRDRIVDAAAALVEQKGLENITLHELAGALGVKTASLYNHLQGLPELNARLSERAPERRAARPCRLLPLLCARTAAAVQGHARPAGLCR